MAYNTLFDWNAGNRICFGGPDFLAFVSFVIVNFTPLGVIT